MSALLRKGRGPRAAVLLSGGRPQFTIGLPSAPLGTAFQRKFRGGGARWLFPRELVRTRNAPVELLCGVGWGGGVRELKNSSAGLAK